MKSKLMNFEGVKVLTTKEQKVIVGGGCGCQGNNASTNGGPRCHEC